MLTCLWCGFTARNSGGLLGHMTSMHQGETFGEMHVRQLNHHNKRVCVQCGALRAGQSRQCHTCGTGTQTRAAVAGDVVVDRSGFVARSGASPQQDDVVTDADPLGAARMATESLQTD
eukprot:3541472-Karenia_brevis.AAC.1